MVIHRAADKRTSFKYDFFFFLFVLNGWNQCFNWIHQIINNEICRLVNRFNLKEYICMRTSMGSISDKKKMKKISKYTFFSRKNISLVSFLYVEFIYVEILSTMECKSQSALADVSISLSSPSISSEQQKKPSDVTP